MTYSTLLHSSSSAVVFNPEKLLRHMVQNQSRAIAIIEIIDRIIADAMTPITDARKAFHREQPHQSSHMLHTLKCSISNIGGLRVVDIIGELEHKLDDSNANVHIVESLFECLEREYSCLLTEAEKWLSFQRSKLMTKAALKAEQEKIQIKQFKQQLENNNLKACDSFQNLRVLLQASLSTEDFQGLGNFIHCLEFEKALMYVKAI